ncbi:MAG: tRNA threonylcarbamoyladenosine dehydratase [Oscillospiraceae bacterium]|nr:tRNA threonylcarbamoyladenosine dehydratase [Oscillospiraceae bacterium]MDD4368645.1 tRNA threonylcarbamoyladenosine dehydratase [Oscillospiraceae bacterium]
MSDPETQFSRSARLLGAESISRLARAKVLIFGVGGVGSYVVEALARTGIGNLILVDPDQVCLSNLNRQLPALHSTIGKLKAEVMRQRIMDINPAARVEVAATFYLPGMAARFLTADLDYVVDAIDTVSAKIDLAVEAPKRQLPLISSMGAGNKVDPTKFQVADIYQTSYCPLARVMRRALRQQGVSSLKVVYSPEPPRKPLPDTEGPRVPGSLAYVPSVAGLIIASEVVRDLLAQPLKAETPCPA